MNEQAYRENQRNKEYTRAYDGGGTKVLEVDKRKVTYQGRKWHDLSSFEKRKLENLIYLGDTDQVPKKIRYI